MLTKIFKILDLTGKDQRIYLTTLKLGLQPASVIARQAGYKRTYTYKRLQTLCERGICRVERRNGVMYFFACSPEQLAGMIQVKKSLILEAEDKLKMVMPVLKGRGGEEL